MTDNVIVIDEAATVIDAAELMLTHRISGLPVVDRKGALVGVISDTDLLRRAEVQTEKRRSWWLQLLTSPGKVADEYVNANGRRVCEVMSRSLVTVSPYATLAEAAELMEQTRVKRLPVVVGGHLVGIVTTKDFLKPLRQTRTVCVFPIDDQTIRSNVEAELRTQQWARNGLIHVGVEGGVVTLSGTIMDERVRAAARVAAENVAGVSEIKDELTWIDPSYGILLPSETIN
ncbi:CBS domain-containing protein [Rhizobium sp. YTU87027]|uniref:CBS domain-containing protein n=1 Tax=Rhizobium sp. YTU87027 TaxID=3417741 RepID=UPI003D69471F